MNINPLHGVMALHLAKHASLESAFSLKGHCVPFCNLSFLKQPAGTGVEVDALVEENVPEQKREGVKKNYVLYTGPQSLDPLPLPHLLEKKLVFLQH